MNPFFISITAREKGERFRGPLPAAKRHLVHFGLKNASKESNFSACLQSNYIHLFLVVETAI